MSRQYQIFGHVKSGDWFITRPEMETLMADLKKGEEFVSITAPRSCGKTSILFAIMRDLQKENAQCCLVDFRSCNPLKEETNTVQWFFSWVLETLVDEFGLSVSDFQTWKEDLKKSRTLSQVDIFLLTFKDFISSRVRERKIIFLDEMEVLRTLGDCSDSFLHALNILAKHKDELSLSILMAGIYPIHMLISDQGRASDIKIDRTIQLSDFSESSMALWAEGIDNEIEISNQIFTCTGGHPYLTGLMHHLVFKEGNSVDEIKRQIIEEAKKANSKYAHFKAPRDFIKENPEIAYSALTMYEAILKGETVDRQLGESKAFNLLQVAGLVKETSAGLVTRCPLYKEVFGQTWVKETRNRLGASSQTPTRNKYLKVPQNKVCLINMGGTIGMVEKDNQVLPPTNRAEFLEIYPELGFFANIDYVQLEAKDGANVFPSDWSSIARTIYEKRNEEYVGFVVAMGTDTMQYAASAVAFALGEGLDRPVVFVGAQATHAAFYGDAQVNLYRAIRIASTGIPEVVICFNNEVYRAVRAQKINDYSFQGFASPTMAPLAMIGETIRIREDLIRQKKPGRISLINTFEDQILQISQYPGLHSEYYIDLIKRHSIKGVMFESLGIGNISNMGEKYNLMPLVRLAVDKNIPVIIASRYPIEPTYIHKYIPAMAPIQEGAIHALNMPSSAALTKLMWLLPQIEKDISEGELTENRKINELKTLMEYSFIGEIDIQNLKDNDKSKTGVFPH